MKGRFGRFALFWLLPLVIGCGATVTWAYLAGTYGANTYGSGNYGTGDITPPVISVISSNTPGQTSATITWSTDEDSTSQVVYGPTSSYGSYSILNTVLASTTHSVVISGLTASTAYHFAVASADLGGNAATSTDQTFTTSSTADVTPPTVSVTAPTNGALIRSSAVALTATAADDVAVAGVTFKVDNAIIGSEDTTFPYSVALDSTGLLDGSHTIVAVARDASGNLATSSTVTVTVDNTAPAITLTAPTNGATITGSSVAFSATASDANGIVGVQFEIDNSPLGAEDTSSPYALTVDSTGLSNGPHTVLAVTHDNAGNYATSSAITVTVSNIVVDSTPPSVSVTSPTNGATIQGSAVTLSANASDNIAVGGVTFKVDGNTIGSEDTTSPYSVTLDSTSLSDGSHTVTAVARDTSNNTTTSSSITVTVSNTVVTPPAPVQISGGGGLVVGTGPNAPGYVNTHPTSDSTATAPTTSGTVTVSPPSPFVFSTNLGFGSTGDEVQQLQIYLNGHNFIVAPSSYGSVGNETTYFGPLTHAALAKFQAANNITPASGFFGPITRAFIESGTPPAAPTETAPTQTTTPTATPAPAASGNYTHDLGLGDVDPDILSLQQYLNANGYKLANFGPGSPGNETQKFGYATQYQLQLFQEANTITPADGSLNAATRAFLNGK